MSKLTPPQDQQQAPSTQGGAAESPPSKEPKKKIFAVARFPRKLSPAQYDALVASFQGKSEGAID